MAKDRSDARVVREKSGGGGHQVTAVGERWADGVLVVHAEWTPGRPGRTQEQAWGAYGRARQKVLDRVRDRFGTPAHIVDLEHVPSPARTRT